MILINVHRDQKNGAEITLLQNTVISWIFVNKLFGLNLSRYDVVKLKLGVDFTLLAFSLVLSLSFKKS